MKKIDHVAIQVNDIDESVKFYVNRFGCEIIHQDDTWAFLQFENIKLALVIEDEHPYHIAFEVDEVEGVEHRDGSVSKYTEDLSGNSIELIKYPTEATAPTRGATYGPIIAIGT